MTALAQSLIAFGSYGFPITAFVKKREASTDIDESKMLNLDGTIAPAGVLKAQKLAVQMDIGHDGTWDPGLSTPTDIVYLLDQDDFNNAANSLLAALDEGYQALTLGYTTPPRTTQAQKESCEVTFEESQGRCHGSIAIEFYIPDPRWLDTTVKSITATGSATSAGNMPSYPIVTYQQTGGGAGAPVSLKVDTGAGYVELNLAITLASGDELVIDCDPRARSFGGIIYTPSGGSPTLRYDLLGTTGIVNTIGNDATFPYLLPGTHTVTLAGANSMLFQWQDAYAL